jgi:BlaI family penicillinase repressor
MPTTTTSYWWLTTSPPNFARPDPGMPAFAPVCKITVFAFIPGRGATDHFLLNLLAGPVLARATGAGDPPHPPEKAPSYKTSDDADNQPRNVPLQTAVLYVTYRNRTFGNATMDGNLLALGDLEREVMQLVWARAPLTAEAVRELLARPLKDSTVRTVLRRLEEKGYVSHRIEGRAFVYLAAEQPGEMAATAVKHIVDWFCNGSVDEILVGMADEAMLDGQQLRALADRIEKAREGRV